MYLDPEHVPSGGLNQNTPDHRTTAVFELLCCRPLSPLHLSALLPSCAWPRPSHLILEVKAEADDAHTSNRRSLAEEIVHNNTQLQ